MSTDPAARLRLANAIRFLSMDAVQQANSGHPGAPMGMADIAEVLWRGHLQHNPNNPDWSNRDRFILSNGHGSMLLYSLLHLSGYDLGIEDIKQFRQLHSKTAGHPEYGYAPGIETTTGPLGQGLANAVGMALAEKILAAQFNRPGFDIVDHHTYCFVGDGCLMEGISHEVASLAGTLALSKLIVVYDDNGISIDGEVEGWFSDDTPARFRAYGWNVIEAVDGHSAVAVDDAINLAKTNAKPTLICAKTIIGKGAPNKQGGSGVHGAALGDAEIAAARAAADWVHEPFEIPADIYTQWNAKQQGAAREAIWQELFDNYQQQHAALAAEFLRRQNGELPDNFEQLAADYITATQAAAQKIATRKASQNAIEAMAPGLPELLGGSADLAGSNLTRWSGSEVVKDNFAGNYINYGVREFGKTAVMNGIALHGGFIPYGGTFLIFMEYARNALRMAALMKQRSILVYTHDSIGLGEDGPTHQPVEQLASMRTTPNLSVWRPCDAVETAVAWRFAIQRQDGPTALALSRQGLATQPRSEQQVADINKGAYVLKDCEQTADLILIATGSEVELAVASAEALQQQGVAVRVVSMPCVDAFEAQDNEYKSSVLPRTGRRVAIEAGQGDLWYKYVGLDGAVVSMDSFGASAPAADLFKLFGFTVENVVAKSLAVLA